MKEILLIGGIDPTGGAGLIKDLTVVHSFGMQASVVVTAVTAQSDKRFYAPGLVSVSSLNKQFMSVLPLSQYHAVKIGMLGNERIVRLVVSFFKRQAHLPPIIVDPVMESTSGGVLLTERGRKVLAEELLPLATLWTPNLDEARYYLSNLTIRNLSAMKEAVYFLWEMKKVPVYLKGGHLRSKIIADVFYNGSVMKVFKKRKKKARLRGTGCALATTIACMMAKNSYT